MFQGHRYYSAWKAACLNIRVRDGIPIREFLPPYRDSGLAYKVDHVLVSSSHGFHFESRVGKAMEHGLIVMRATIPAKYTKQSPCGLHSTRMILTTGNRRPLDYLLERIVMDDLNSFGSEAIWLDSTDL